MTRRRLINEEEFLQLFPITSRQLRDYRTLRKIPFIKLSRTVILYDPDKVAAALDRLEIKEVV